MQSQGENGKEHKEHEEEKTNHLDHMFMLNTYRHIQSIDVW